MHKKYKENLKSTWIIIPLFGAGPLITLIYDPHVDTVLLVQIAIYLLASIVIFKYHNRTVAEIQGDTLRIYSGIGLNDPSQIYIHSINRVKRISKKLLTIHYDNKQITIEAHHKVLTELENDIVKN